MIIYRGYRVGLTDNDIGEKIKIYLIIQVDSTNSVKN